MEIDKRIIKQAAKASGISEEDLTAFFSEGERRNYKPNEWLFQESTPRQWAGIWRKVKMAVPSSTLPLYRRTCLKFMMELIRRAKLGLLV